MLHSVPSDRLKPTVPRLVSKMSEVEMVVKSAVASESNGAPSTNLRDEKESLGNRPAYENAVL